jgi:hypothetical protein
LSRSENDALEGAKEEAAMAGINEALAARARRLARENNPEASPRRLKYVASAIFGVLASTNLITLGE